MQAYIYRVGKQMIYQFSDERIVMQNYRPSRVESLVNGVWVSGNDKNMQNIMNNVQNTLQTEAKNN